MQNNNNKPTTCQFYVQRKKRYCKFQVPQNSTFCNAHNQNVENKILCPYQKQTYINIHQLEKHLEVCPKFKDKKIKEQSKWFSKGINSISKQTTQSKQINIKQLYTQKDQQFMNLLHKLPNLFFQVFEKDQQQNPLYFLDLKSQNLQTLNENKDLLQSKLLSNLIQTYHLLSLNNIYVQFGAGKGILSSSIANMFKFQHSKHILLEREARRNKFDKNFRENPFFQRYRSDVEDFNLSNIRETMINHIKQNPKISQQQLQKYQQQLKQTRIVGVCKHMCGQATDLSIQALINANDKIKIAGTVMATCCHHLCSYHRFLNKEFWKQLNLNTLQIQMIFKMSSWGVMKNECEKQKTWTKQSLLVELKQNIQQLKNYQKIIMGKMCKRMIDKARSYVIEQNLKKKVKIIRYCNEDVTPQNFALVAFD